MARLPEIGDTFANRFRLRAELGRGGFGVVFDATDTATGRQVALKLLRPMGRGGYEPKVQARFQREVKVVGELRSPYTVRLLAHGLDDGICWAAFELVPGRDLSALLSADQRLAPSDARNILLQILESLREAHRLGLIHRDLKPENIRVFEGSRGPLTVKVLDFGIARPTEEGSPSLTATGELVGTPRYMSPEQLRGVPLTPASDIYSAGLLTYELLAGSDALAGNNLVGQIERLSPTFRFDVPGSDEATEALMDVVRRMLVPDPRHRLSSVDAVLDLLEPRRRAERLDTTAAAKQPLLVGAAVALLAAGAGVAWLMKSEPPPPAPVAPPSRNITGLVQHEPSPMIDAGTSEDALSAADADAARPVGGCGREPPFRGYGELRTEDGETMAAFVPKSYDPTKPAALVIGFHRRFNTGMTFIRGTELATQAERHNWVIIAPEQNQVGSWASTPEPFLDAMDVAISQLCIDRRYLHLVGDEAGVSQVNRLSCRYPVSSVVTSFASHLGTVCEPAAPSPYLRMHTLQDKLHPADGKPCSVFLGKLASFDWIDRGVLENYTCHGTGAPWAPHPDACRLHDQCELAPVVICGFDGGHRWPAGTVAIMLPPGCEDDPNTEAPMAEAVADFITEFAHPLTDEEIANLDESRGAL